MNKVSLLVKTLVVLLPFLLMLLLNGKNNLKKKDRSRQCYMPIVAVVFCMVVGFMLGSLVNLILDFINNLSGWILAFAAWVGGLFDGALSAVSGLLERLAQWFENLIKDLDIAFWAEVLVNALVVLIYLVFKRVVITVLKLICKDGVGHYEWAAKLAYQKRPEDGCRYLKPHMAQGVTLTKVLYYVSILFGVVGTVSSVFLYDVGLTASLYYPVLSVIMVGEIYFFLDGPQWVPEASSLSGEAERSGKICDYTFLRQVLSRSFGDKLMADNTSVNSDLLHFKTNSEIIDELVDHGQTPVEAYGLFMQKKAASGLEIDQNYLDSGLELLNGKSVIFNNPFYYDLIPYVFFPINRAILRRKKVLIVLGRHAIEQDVKQWCEEGLTSVTQIPGLWSVDVLDGEEKNPDVGIVTRSSVHDLQMHEQNAEFFKDVEFVMLIEPSRLVATAQIGLNSLIRLCRREDKKLVFCSADKNCDGLVDALSHILMTSLEEVTATNKHKGTSSYMCWEADEEHLQHRMLPNLSRYLGVGTEMSFMALKNQVTSASWYGGEAFPVQDMHWIAKQYYYDLLKYASLPTVQSTFDEVFQASANMWNATVKENNYLTVEDESYNMYEAKRAFATRAKNQGFVNVISTDYLLKDYMAANDGIFDADSKAIPYIVADYAHTERNVIYRLCLRMTTYPLLEEDIRQELGLLNVDLGENLIQTLWSYVCRIAQSVENRHFDEQTGKERLKIRKDGRDYTFDASVISSERRYSFKTGNPEIFYSIRNKQFIKVFLDDLCSAEYVAEDETDKNRFLGTELRGHIFQKYLPGQFFTFGGKYYEMLRQTLDGRVIVRRAADHINGRPQYRQVRDYRLFNVADSTLMGDKRDIGGICVTKQNADIEVDTPAYWRMKRYHDFQTGKKIAINGVPTRRYYNKQLLRIDFPEQIVQDKKTLDTVALLMNEVFRTLYAENQGMIVAVTAGQAEAPSSYSLYGEGVEQNSLYIIEDSQMDIGFLVSVERNLTRIFSIICDYLQWHSQTLEQSLRAPAAPEMPDFTITDEQREAEAAEEKEQKKNKGIRGFFRRIGAFFKKLFGRKTKDPQKPEKPKKEKVKKPKKEKVKKEKPAKPEKAEKPKKEKKPWWKRKKGEEAPEQETPAEETPAEEVTEQEVPAEETPAEEAAVPEEPTLEGAQEPQENASEGEHPVLMNIAPPKRLYSLAPAPQEAPAAEEVPAQDVPEAEPSAEQPAQPEQEDTVSVEPDQAKRPADSQPKQLVRKPYHERYYLLFGGTEEPQTIDVGGTLELLRGLGFGKGSLEQARNGLSEIENVEKNFDPDRQGSHYCDFCGTELFGSEYEILADGRERCMICGRTAVKTEKEFKKIYQDIIKNLTLFFGIKITAPVNIQMVNAKKLHKKLGRSFVPTGKADGRVLGVAIRDKKEGYSILLENGSPRLSATMTMVHELTHIWQYLNWDAGKIKHMYGRRQNLEIYEGMAKWVEIQYAYLINEAQTAKREEIITRMRDDEYGHGFLKYAEVYPLSTGSRLLGTTPFDNVDKPL